VARRAVAAILVALFAAQTACDGSGSATRDAFANEPAASTLSPRLAQQWLLREGDVIIRVGAVDVADADAAAQAFDRDSGAGRVAMIVETGGTLRQIIFQIDR
jgi:hypothetical protein